METHLPAVTKLSSRVTRILGFNPGRFTLQGTNTYLVGTGKERLLIDSGEGKMEYIRSLKSVLEESKEIVIVGIVLTHWHHDHVDGIPSVLELCKSRGNSTVPLYKRLYPDKDRKDFEFSNIAEGQVFSVEGATLKAYHAPGHTSDHMIFQLKEENAMFSGDNVLGHGTSMFENLQDYMKSLRRMKILSPSKIYPGHGDVVTKPAEILNLYINNLQFREARVVSLLKQLLADPSREEKYVTVGDIAKKMYGNLSMDIFTLGERMIKLHLEKLQAELSITPIICEDRSVAWTLPKAQLI
ncbi:Beta-lactamase-like protein 2 [Basidiobolus ranarum]|uniref:Beta-lactamase-like protein 2 n=1 Tax=Basidiobolus ranarum TaxID=34480 RepID=A0ABR2VVU0_9FUNG